MSFVDITYELQGITGEYIACNLYSNLFCLTFYTRDKKFDRKNRSIYAHAFIYTNNIKITFAVIIYIIFKGRGMFVKTCVFCYYTIVFN